MSAPLSIDAYDAQMLDFSSDPDVPMNITGSAEFFAEALMDHDDHLSASIFGEHTSVEVDMEEYVGDNAEYEMADETSEYPRPHGDELLDVEVYDASHVPSPLVPLQPLPPPVDVSINSEHPPSTSSALVESASLPEVQGEPESEAHATPLDHLAADVSHVEPSAPGEGVSLEVVSLELTHPADAPDENTLPVSESHEHLGDTAPANGQPFETPAPADAVDEAVLRVPPVVEEPPVNSEVAQQEAPEPSSAEPAPLGSGEAYDNGSLIQDEKAADQATVTEGEAVNPLHISDGVYIDPPPAVLLSVVGLSQPAFVLFNQPHEKGEATVEARDDRGACSLLLENRPTLYYEPLSSVFDALRQDEDLLSRVPHSFEGELVIDAYDLQLAVSEDNVHSREISLHDLNILHDGSDFAGPLRLLLRAVAPRFIIRYYELQEQIQRLNVAAESGEGEHTEEHRDQHDTSEEQRLLQEEAVSTYATAVSDRSEVPSTAEAEGPAKELAYPPESTEETPQESSELEDTSTVQEPTTEYHEIAGEATRAVEDENDYENSDSNEGESIKAQSLDADQVHRTAEDTDAQATVTRQESEFGGEQIEYLDYVQSEEYDEQYGEDLPERAYGEPPRYEEGERDTSTAVDETQALLPDSDEDEEEGSAATPIPACAVLEPELKEPADNNVDDPVLSQQDNQVTSGEELVTSGSTNEVIHASDNHEADIAHAKVFSEVEESDSNFVSMLEREADTEFDRTFDPEQNEQEGSIETALHHELTWDEWDDEDAEGEDEEDWIDPDVASNESSVTLSSKASSKRSIDEVDPNEEAYLEDPQASPGSKRARVE